MAHNPKVIINTGETQSNATFKFHQETHTIGNALRHILARDTNTEYVAYTIPHPSEPYLNFRLQTYEGSAQDHILKGLSTFTDVADSILTEFERAYAQSSQDNTAMSDDVTPAATTTTTTTSKKSDKKKAKK